MDISEIAQAILIVDRYFWNSKSQSHSGWIFLKQWRCKGHAFLRPPKMRKNIFWVLKNQISMKKKIKNFTFAYSQGQGGWTIGFEQHDYCDIEIKYYLVFLYWNFKTGGGGSIVIYEVILKMTFWKHSGSHKRCHTLSMGRLTLI